MERPPLEEILSSFSLGGHDDYVFHCASFRFQWPRFAEAPLKPPAREEMGPRGGVWGAKGVEMTRLEHGETAPGGDLIVVFAWRPR